MYSIPDIWEEEGSCHVFLSFLLCYMLNNTDIRGKVEPRQACKCCIVVTRHVMRPPTPPPGPMLTLPCGRKCVYFSVKGRCAMEKVVEKRQTDLANVTWGQAIRKIGETLTALLHSLRAKTCACSAGHCHAPDSRRCSASARPWICTLARSYIQIFCSLSIHPSSQCVMRIQSL